MTLADLNRADRRTFVDAVGWVFEHAPWVAERAWAERPFPSLDVLHAVMVRVMLNASREDQLALLQAHPDLGSRLELTGASAGEQAAAGLDRLPESRRAALRRRNEAYRERFGFPFLLAVRGATPDQIDEALDRRLQSTLAEEWAEALRQVARIARNRLETMHLEASP